MVHSGVVLAGAAVHVLLVASAVAAQANATYIDTLNRGRELRLSARDLRPVEGTVTPSVAAPQEPSSPTSASTAGSGVTVDGFRIQCFASSDLEALQREKKKVEEKTGQTAYIASEQNVYRLQVGNFATRAEAENALKTVRLQGFTDAWIVRTRIEKSSGR